ncbi:DNA repair protein RadA [Patescibacteria group bacterium]|nr:DNA repair protein RadA [Patescibacteria group bacterium]MBU2035893.1 DNA repair protein RadA [Patescibacteria group bacterium]
MARFHSQYVCQQCGYSQVGWAGKCPNCDTWGSLVETVIESKSSSKRERGTSSGQAKKITSLASVNLSKTPRLSTKISELDRVLGGGLVPGQVVLLAGEPGIGKSTLLLQLANSLGNFIYVSGEESAQQIKIRAKRLGINKDVSLIEETNLENILETIKAAEKPNGVIIDSIQTMQTSDLSGLAGSVGQVRECSFRYLKYAKGNNVPVFLVGHVTKVGTVAGPAVLSHIVDTVLWFEGDKATPLRLLRAVKNRFGATDEVGIFEMQEKGLISLVNAEKIFLSKTRKQIAGTVVSSIMQGSRPILVEVESLVVPTKMAFPKKIAQGIDSRRLELLLAVLIRRCSLPLYEYDCFVNIAGGIKVMEPASDLAVCLSIASAFLDKPLLKGSIAIGEVGLSGEIREVVAQEKRVKEAKRQGFNIPITNKQVKYLSQAIKNYLR